MVRISDNSPSWIEGLTPFPLSQSTKTIHHNHIKFKFSKDKDFKSAPTNKEKKQKQKKERREEIFLNCFFFYWDSHSMQG